MNDLIVNVALEPLYIHKEGVVDYVGGRINGNWDSSKTVVRKSNLN